MSDMFRFGTKRYFIAAMQANGLTNIQAYNELKSLVARQVEPWIFKSNVPGSGRTAKPLSLQYQELQNEINRVYSLIERTGNPIPSGTEIPTGDDATTSEDSSEVKEEIPTAVKPVVKSSKARKDSEKAHFYNEWLRLRQWISTTVENTGAVAVDSLETMRPLVAANAMIDEGISARTMLHSMCMHWPKATLDMAAISPSDYSFVDGHVEALPAPKTAKSPYDTAPISESAHVLSGYVAKLVNARQNVMLIGSAGTGKSFLTKQVADHLGLRYGETPMTPGATRGDLLGRPTIQGFITSEFVEIYSQGGIFNFEEIDASDPSMLIVVNNALASNHLYNSANGERYERHPDFVAVSTANTFGLGADSKYTGREKLDLATIDRFRMGRVMVTLDEDLARSLIVS